MIRFTPGNAIELLRSGGEFFPALTAAIDGALREVWIETYIFADDAVGREIAATLVAAAARGVTVRVLVDGWGAKLYLTRRLERALRDGGVKLMKYRPEVAPWQFRSHRLRRLHRKLCHVDRAVAFVGGINIIDDMNTPHQKPPRLDFAVRVRGPLVAPVVQTMQRLWALVELVQLERSEVPLFPDPIFVAPAGDQVAKFVIRDNLRYRRDIERAYLAAIRTAKREIVIANAYFFPGVRFRRALIAAADRGVNVTLLLQARVEYRLLHYASRALYGQLLAAGVSIAEYHRSFLHAKVAVVDDHWATVGSSNIDPYSLLMAREANVFVRDPHFADQLRIELLSMIDTGTRHVELERWSSRNPLSKALTWIAYGIVRVMMGFLGYGGQEWFPRRTPRLRDESTR
jgi:cardiolipin synthase